LNKRVFSGKTVTSVQFEGDNTISELKFFAPYVGTNAYELETFVKSINVDDRIGKEIVLLVKSFIQNVG